MADITYEHLPPERQHALLMRRLRVAEEDHFKATLQHEAPLPNAPDSSSQTKLVEELESSIKTLRKRRDAIEKAVPALKDSRVHA